MACHRPRNGARARHRPAQCREGLPVHLMDIHLEKGMHCVDCHFIQDIHGNTKLYGEVRAAIEITVRRLPRLARPAGDLVTSGPASRPRRPSLAGGRDLPFGDPVRQAALRARRERIFQNSMVEPDLSWEVVQTADTIDPTSDHYNVQLASGQDRRFDGRWQAGLGRHARRGNEHACISANSKMSCIACHSLLESKLLRLPPAAAGQYEDARACTSRATCRGTTSPTTSRPSATTFSCWPTTAT